MDGRQEAGVSRWKLLRVRAPSSSRVRRFVTLWTAAHQPPLAMEFSRQEYWSGVPFPPPGGLPHPGIDLASPAEAGGLSTTEPPGKSRLSPMEWINKVLLCGTGNYIQYPPVNHNGKKNVCIYIILYW